MKPNANRRCQQIGLDEMFPGVTTPFPWMAEMRPEEGEELLRNARHRVSDGRGVELGLNG
jgi:hypothetical protein